MKLTLIAVLLVIFPRVAIAQMDSTYIQSLSNLIALKVSVNNEINGFDLNVGDTEYEVYPNTSIHNSYTLSYRFLTLTFSFDPGAVNLNSDTDIRGKTKTIHYGTELRFNRFVQFLGYNSTEGYFLRNTEDFDPTWNEGLPYIQYPDVAYSEFQGITLFKLNPNLSIAALSAPNTRQLKTVGTFIPNISYRYYTIDDDSGVIENTVRQEVKSFEASISPGYMQTFVFNERFYISLGTFPGIGSRKTNLKTETLTDKIESNRKTLIYRMALVSGIGYDTGKFYFGSRFVNNFIHQSSNDGQATLDRNETNFEVFVGVRFIPPSVVKTSFDWLTEVIPIIK